MQTIGSYSLNVNFVVRACLYFVFVRRKWLYEYTRSINFNYKKRQRQNVTSVLSNWFIDSDDFSVLNLVKQ